MNQREFRQLTEWIQTVLRVWDPIGVSQWADDEYDSYAPKIASLLLVGADKVKLSDHLFQIVTNAMGLSGDRTRCDEIGHRLNEGFATQVYRHQYP